MPDEIIYDESQVPDYVLPECLLYRNGSRVGTPDSWVDRRRPEILTLFRQHVYGHTPVESVDMKIVGAPKAESALDGIAYRVQVELIFAQSLSAHVLLYLPIQSNRPIPVFLGLNFFGNHTVCDDPAIAMARGWMRENDEKGIVEHRATEATRGSSASRWAIREMVERGYGFATVYCGDFDPDYHDHFKNGVHALFRRDADSRTEWGTISAWAWGLSRVLDYLASRDDVDGGRVIVMGHSRLGKTALWAAAQDERFAAAISNNSGCGGAALSRRRFGETVYEITNRFPHWFCDRFADYAGKEDDLPVDQHMLLSLIAPRPLYVASAEEDLWSDPRGEYLGAVNASEVYELLGHQGLKGDTMPDTDTPISGRISYHIRSGGHDVTDFDWRQYLRFADDFVR